MNKRFFCAVMAAMLAAALPIRAAETPALPSLLPGLMVENYPRVDGSTSTWPIGSLLSSRVTGLLGEWRRGEPNRYTAASLVFTFPVQTETASIARYQQIAARNQHHGTHESYKALIDGQSDLILVARPPSADELKAVQAKNVKFDVRPVALDAFVFLVNRANVVNSLTLAQLRDVFGGKVRQWREVGGKDFPIKLFGRERNSGSQELMESLVMQGRAMAPAPNLTLITSMGEVIQRVAENPNAISYSVFYYEHFMAPDPRNKLLAIGSVTPNAETIRNGNYPLVAPVYMVTRQDIATDSPTARLRDWLLGADGQQLIAAGGYVPLPIKE